VAECFGLSGLKGHRTGGSIHFIINNQIGFTTNPRFSRSSPYPSDVAKMIEAPIFHVNGDDPEAVVYAAKIATEFRQKFHKPVVIDMICYRRYGHNEGDEPAFTQPIMYKKIRSTPDDADSSMPTLVKEGRGHRGDLEAMRRMARRPRQEFEIGQEYKPNKADWLDGKWAGFGRRGRTIRAAARPASIWMLKTSAQADRRAGRLQRPPHDPALHENRKAMIDSGEGIDWATGEALAFGSLAVEGNPVRLSGQDASAARSRSATRCSTIRRRKTLHPAEQSRRRQARYEVINSMLSEEAVLGFEYGYSLAEPNALTCGKPSSATSPMARRSVRPVHLLGRAQMAAHVGPRLPAAARL
jgi:2-oxoglutarate dehydrogenase E1 component